MTIVAENTGNNGKTTKRVIKTLSITVKDARTPSITAFKLKKGSTSYTGTIDTAALTITVKVAPGTNVTKLLPVITKAYDSLKITYGEASTKFVATDSLDFTNPVKFKISTNASSTLAAKSKEYTVTVTERAKYVLASLLTLKSNSSKLAISLDATNKKVAIKLPWGVSLTADSLKAKFTATASTGAVVTWGSTKLNGNTAVPFTVPNNSADTIKVTSESGTVITPYPVTITQKAAFTSFTLNDSVSSLYSSSQLVTIDNTAKTIVVKLLGTASVLTKGYIATFAGTDYAKVTVNGSVQVSGATKNYFPTAGLVYTVTSNETGETTSYTVTIVLVSKK